MSASVLMKMKCTAASLRVSFALGGSIYLSIYLSKCKVLKTIGIPLEMCVLDRARPQQVAPRSSVTQQDTGSTRVCDALITEKIC